MELKCTIQTYNWGKKGVDSTVAMLMKSANPDFQLDEQKPYAELWMGTHTNGPSYLKDGDIPLDTFLLEKQDILGTEIEQKFGKCLPFLFKVLSVNTALSVQVHPSKEKAKELHLQYPNIYKDPNHKPELAIALTPFEALCGFRPMHEIKEYLKALPELCTVIGDDKVHDFLTCDESGLQLALKRCFNSLMICDSGMIALQLRKLTTRLFNSDESTRQSLNARLLEQLYSDFPGDVGCFCIYFFNWITMQPGEAIYLPANEPHAYLSGDCVECMASSDNVVRAGLTPKLKDVPTLIEILTYKCEPAAAKRFQPSREDECTEVFRPPVADFAVAKITIPPGRPSYSLIVRNTASILIIVNGKAEISPARVFHRGSVLFIPANKKLDIKVLCGCHPMLMFQAFANV